MDEGVQPLFVVTLRIDEFFLNDKLLTIIEDVHLSFCLCKPRVFKGLGHSQALFRVPLKEPFD